MKWKSNYVKAHHEEFTVVWTKKVGELSHYSTYCTGMKTKLKQIKGPYIDNSSLKSISVRYRNFRNPQGQRKV